MFRRTLVVSVVVVALLVLATPALAGGWAVVTLDALPSELRAGQPFQLGFMVRQHGVTPTNKDLNGRALQPMLTAHKQVSAGTAIESIRLAARQEGPVGHYVVDMSFPSDGEWEWQIEVPTFYVQNGPDGQNAAVFAPLSVLPARATTAVAPAAPEATVLGLSPAMLRLAGVGLLLLAAGLGLASQRSAIARRPARSS